MKKKFLKIKLLSFTLMILGFFVSCFSFGQTLQEKDKQVLRETNKLLRNAEDELAENDFASAEASYRKAVAKNPESVKAKYNMANMYYGKEKPAQAASRLKQAAEVAESKEEKHKIFHNLGNSFMEQKKYKEAVEAYKNSLRNNPTDEETRYNLALAKKMLEKEEQEGGGGDQDQENEGEDKEENDENKSEGDEGEKEQDKQEGDDKEDQGGNENEDSKEEPKEQDEDGEPKDQNEQENGQPDEPQPQQPQPGQLSPQQINSLLEAMNNEERKVQDKMNAEKAKGAKVRTEKDW